MALLSSPTYSLTPSSTPAVLSSNYISDFDFLKTELPEVYEEQFEIYGDRSVASYLRMAAAEYPFASDLVKWTEEGRLHTVYTDASRAGNVFTKNSHVFRVRQTVLVSDGTNIARGIISAKDTNTFTVQPFDASGWPAGLGTSNLTVFVYGSEFQKGTDGMQGALKSDPSFKENSPIIIKDRAQFNGSELTQIGWVEVSTEMGGSGYLYYLKSQHETRLRFEDYLETSMIEGVPAGSGSDAETNASAKGTEGLFYSIEQNGNIQQTVPTTIGDFDAIIKRMDKQGAIKENMIFAERDLDLAIDDMLAQQNSYGVGGTSYGVFNNSEQMALKLGFSGFKRGGYEFYKTSWKYLNDATTRGAIDGTGKIRGIITPVGTKTIYDQILGENIKMPFLHVKYRKTAVEDRRYKTTVTGGAGGANNSSLDALTIDFLSERVLCTIGVNNFIEVQD